MSRRTVGNWSGLAFGLALLAGCSGGGGPPAFEDEVGFHFTPPPGWVERARPAAAGGKTTPPRRGGKQPLPPVGAHGERLLVRYDRLTAGRLAWLRITAADVPERVRPQDLLAPPGSDWQRRGKVEEVSIGDRLALRAAWRGRWQGQDYLNETMAMRGRGRVYLVAASFPASDTSAREEVRRAVAEAVWP